jgi:glycine dehydrogenase
MQDQKTVDITPGDLMNDRDRFVDRHIGRSDADLRAMLDAVGVESLDELIDQTVPDDIRLTEPLDLPGPMGEFEALRRLESIALKNQIHRSYIGMGYYNTVTPAVIRRNILENPGWYTQYTPYQAEISPGPARSAAELPDDDRRPDRPADRQRVAAGRGTAAAEAMACASLASAQAEKLLRR